MGHCGERSRPVHALARAESPVRRPGFGKLYSLLAGKMSTMNDIQYVYDAAGHRRSVIIPIELWEKTLRVTKPRHASCNPQEYYGIYREKILNPEAVAQALRDEWNRI